MSTSQYIRHSWNNGLTPALFYSDTKFAKRFISSHRQFIHPYLDKYINQGEIPEQKWHSISDHQCKYLQTQKLGYN